MRYASYGEVKRQAKPAGQNEKSGRPISRLHEPKLAAEAPLNASQLKGERVVLTGEAKKVTGVQGRPSSHTLRKPGRRSITPGLANLINKANAGGPAATQQAQGADALIAGLFQNFDDPNVF